MTFSIAARAPESALFGCAITTSSLAVGSRCCYARAGVGAALTQHRTDPRLGPRIPDSMAEGRSAQSAIDAAVAGAEHVGWRQLAAIDSRGRTGFFHGQRIYSVRAESRAENCVAIGNIIDNPGVPTAMTAGFEAAASLSFPERLIRALEAGLEAGGESQPVRSAQVYVIRDQAFPLLDLRIDWATAPVAALKELLQLYDSEIEAFTRKVLDPDSVPIDPAALALARERLAASQATR